MLTIITGTNRPENQTQIVVNYYINYLKSKGVNCQNLKLTDLPENFLTNEMYGKSSDSYKELVEKYIKEADRFVFVVPEYNGSYAGVLKVFIDSIATSNFRGKKAAVVGVSDGRAGNVLGMDHFIATLNHIGIATVPFRLPISRIMEMINNNKELINPEIVKNIERQADALINF